MSIKKDYKIKKSVYVTKNILESLYWNYYGSFPKHIWKELIKFIKLLNQELEKDHICLENDILKFELIERIEYDNT